MSSRNFTSDNASAVTDETLLHGALGYPATPPTPITQPSNEPGSCIYRNFAHGVTLLAFLPPHRRAGYVHATAHTSGAPLVASLISALSQPQPGAGLTAFTAADVPEYHGNITNSHDITFPHDITYGDRNYGRRFEVKSDKKCWKGGSDKATTNCFIEYRQWGRGHEYPNPKKATPSGITTSQASTYAIALGNLASEDIAFVVLAPLNQLTAIVIESNLKKVQGGRAADAANDNPTIGALLPLRLLLA